MKQTVTLYTFREAFRLHGRQDNFSYQGLEALFNFLEQIEEGSGVEMELDVIALCCDFSECDLDDINYQYSEDGEPWETLQEAVEFLQEQTTVIQVDDETVIVQAY